MRHAERRTRHAERRPQNTGRETPNGERGSQQAEPRTQNAQGAPTRAARRPATACRVLFRVAAGPRIGHGHLRRAAVLARALGWPAVVSIRGAARPPAALMPVAPAGAGPTLDAVAPDLLVLDDPHAVHGDTWVRAAVRRRVPVVSLHDLGLARVASTMAIDGSVVSPAGGWPSDRVLRGLDYAVIASPARRRAAGGVRRVLISLGGGPRPALTQAIVAQLRRRHPDVELLVTHVGPELATRPAAGVRPIVASGGLAPWLARVDAAIIGGGVSLYEAIAAGVPSVAVPVVPAQRPTIRGFHRLRLTIDGGARAMDVSATARHVAAGFDALMADPRWRREVRRTGPRTIDGRGAQRVARAIAALTEDARHA